MRVWDYTRTEDSAGHPMAKMLLDVFSYVCKIDIGAVNKFYDLARIGDVMAREHYMALDKTDSDCISCEQCNSRCPFSVDQMSRMQEIKELFENGVI